MRENCEPGSGVSDAVSDYRSELLDWAKGEIGPGRRADYWCTVFGSDPGPKLAWCGVMCLAGLHYVGLTKAKWKLGVGFVGPLGLPMTRTPSRGDILYAHAPFQHHALFDYTHDGWVHSVDGNQPDVREKKRRPAGLVFYSIQPLIDAMATEPRERDTLPVPKMPTVWIGHCDIVIGLELQRLLAAKGFPLKVDGVFGPKTHAVVKQFQLVSNITTDGIVGEKTWLALMT